MPILENNSLKIWQNEIKYITLQPKCYKKELNDDKNRKLLVVAQLKIRKIVRR